jgi:hypothetical protein
MMRSGQSATFHIATSWNHGIEVRLIIDRETIPVGPCYVFLEPSRQMGVEIQCSNTKNVLLSELADRKTG